MSAIPMKDRRTWPPLLVAGMGMVLLAFVGVHAWRMHRSEALAEDARSASAAPAQPTERWLVVGDSTGVGVGASVPARSIAGRLIAASPSREVTNLAVSGARFVDVMRQLEGTQGAYDTVLIQAGGNDTIGGHGMTVIKYQLRELLTLAKTRGKRVLLMPSGDVGNAPMFSWPLSLWMHRRSRLMHDVAVKVTGEQGVTLVDLYRPGNEDPFAREPDRYFAADGLHPSDGGYGLWFAELEKAALRGK